MSIIIYKGILLCTFNIENIEHFINLWRKIKTHTPHIPKETGEIIRKDGITTKETINHIEDPIRAAGVTVRIHRITVTMTSLTATTNETSIIAANLISNQTEGDQFQGMVSSASKTGHNLKTNIKPTTTSIEAKKATILKRFKLMKRGKRKTMIQGTRGALETNRETSLRTEINTLEDIGMIKIIKIGTTEIGTITTKEGKFLIG